jgi:hypothetical protein
MSFACPKCGSRFLSESKPRAGERKTWFSGPVRCKDCNTRFITKTFVLSDLRWARCPRCFRMDLNRWTGRTYDPPLRVALKTALGAKRWRCEYCRLNFASFRDRKEIFTFSRWKKFQG